MAHRSGEPDPLPLAVREVHDNLLPSLHRLLTKSLGRELDVAIVETRWTTFGLYLQSLGPSFWSYRFRVEGHEGWANLALTAPLCAALVNPDGGGEEAALFESPPCNESIGSIPGPDGALWVEYATVIARFVKALAPQIEKAWETVLEMSMRDINLQTEPSSVQLNRPTDPAIHVEIAVESEGSEGLTLNLCYLHSLLGPSLPEPE